MKQKIIKYLTITTLILFISISIFTQEVNSLDEIWNFSNAKNVANGLLPYKDFNLIVTPLYAYINSITLKLLTPKLYIYRINYIILFTLLIFTISKLLKKYNINKYKKYIFCLLYGYFLIKTTYSDYNFFNLILLTLILYLENKNYNKKKYITNIIIGIICGLMILTKQTTGLIISITSIIIIPSIFYLIYKEKQKNNILIKSLGIIITILPFIFFLYKNNIIDDFIDQTIIGIKTFKGSNHLSFLQIIILILITIILVFLFQKLYKIIKTKNKNEKSNAILIIYAIATLSLNYPIIDPTHFIISILPSSLYFIKNYKPKKSPNLLIILIEILLIINYENYKSINIYLNNYKINNFKTYKFINIFDLDNIYKITNYIKRNDNVIIIDHSASTYMIALNKYNKYFDIPLPGNIGSTGEQKMIEKIQEKEYIILISKNSKKLKEELPLLYKYLQKNYVKTETIENFQALTKST